MDFQDAFSMSIEHEFARKAFSFSVIDSDVRAASFLEAVVPVFDVV